MDIISLGIFQPSNLAIWAKRSLSTIIACNADNRTFKFNCQGRGFRTHPPAITATCDALVRSASHFPCHSRPDRRPQWAFLKSVLLPGSSSSEREGPTCWSSTIRGKRARTKVSSFFEFSSKIEIMDILLVLHMQVLLCVRIEFGVVWASRLDRVSNFWEPYFWAVF